MAIGKMYLASASKAGNADRIFRRELRRGRLYKRLPKNYKRSKTKASTGSVAKSGISRSIGGAFPLRKYISLEYKNYWHPTTSLSSTASATVYFNDPYASTTATWGINGQPFFYDQYLAGIGPYGRYCTYAADVTLTFMNGSAGSPGSALIQISPDDTYSTLSTPNLMSQYSGQPNSIYIPYIGVKGDSNSLKIVNKHIDVARILGMTRKS